MAEYKLAKKDFVGWWNEKKKAEGGKAIVEDDEEALAQAIASLEDDGGVAKSTQVLRLRQLVGEGKIKAAVDWIQDFLESGEKLVVFAHHIAVQQRLVARLAEQKVPARRLMAEMTPQARNQAVKDFQMLDTVRVIVCSINVAGMGLTLTAASACLFVETVYVPTVIEQASGRINRIGQTADKTLSYHMRAKGTVDDRVAEILMGKAAVIEAGIGAA